MQVHGLPGVSIRGRQAGHLCANTSHQVHNGDNVSLNGMKWQGPVGRAREEPQSPKGFGALRPVPPGAESSRR